MTNHPKKQEIIYCKHCIYHGYDKGIPYCAKIDYGYGWEDYDFCSHAEKKKKPENNKNKGV